MNINIVLATGEDGYVVDYAPELKSCWSQGRTYEEALENILEAINLYLEPRCEHPPYTRSTRSPYCGTCVFQPNLSLM